MRKSQKIWAFLKLTRPLFLVGGLQLYLLGAFAAVAAGAHLDLGRLFTGQVLVTAIQLMTHYCNEYFDIEGDRLNPSRTWFSGGSGVLSDGVIAPRTAWQAARIFAGIGLIALIAAGWQVPSVIWLGLLALAAAWFYSAPPLALARRGLGELSASLVVAGMVPIVGYMMQSGGQVSPVILVACIPLILIHLAMLIAFQIPDRQADAQVGKRTLTVRLGPEGAVRLHNLSLFTAFCVILGLTFTRWPGAQLLWLALPLAFWQILTIGRYLRGPSPRFLWLTMGAIGLFAATAGLWLVGLIMMVIRLSAVTWGGI